MGRRKALSSILNTGIYEPHSTKGGGVGSHAYGQGHGTSAPSILKPPGTSGVQASTRKGRLMHSKSAVSNSTLCLQPLGHSEWLRGTKRDRDRNGPSDASFESHLRPSSSKYDSESKFAPEEVDSLLDILCVSDSQSSFEALHEEGLQDDGDSDASADMTLSSTSADELEQLECDEEEVDEDVGEEEGEGELACDSTEYILLKLNKTHTVEENLKKQVTNKLLSLETEVEIGRDQLRQWVDVANGLHSVCIKDKDKPDDNDYLSFKSRIESQVQENAMLLDRCQQGEKKNKSLEQEINQREQQLHEANDNCSKLRAALVDAELEIERQTSTVDDDLQSECSSLRACCQSLRIEVDMKEQLLLESHQALKTSNFRLEKAEIQIRQQNIQMNILRDEIKRLQISKQTVDSAELGHIKDYSKRIDDNSREISFIQNKISDANYFANTNYKINR